MLSARFWPLCPWQGLTPNWRASIHFSETAKELRDTAGDKPSQQIAALGGGVIAALAMLRWQQDVNVAWHYIQPTDNAFIEAFNGRLRAECLNTHWFLSLADAREKLEDWRRDYNEVRPHGAIGNKPPAALLNCIGATSPSMPKETGKSTLR